MMGEKSVCPYKKKDDKFVHVFYYGGADLWRVNTESKGFENLGSTKTDVLYCDNTECNNLDKSAAYFPEGEREAVGICKTNAIIENSELVKKIKETSFFKKLEEEKSEEARKQAVLDELEKAERKFLEYDI